MYLQNSHFQILQENLITICKIIKFHRITLTQKFIWIKFYAPNSFKPPHVITKAMKEFVTEFSLTTYSTDNTYDTNTEKVIINFSNTFSTDIIGMCTYGRTGFAYFLTAA
ncbi:hypothetical protein [Flavobacterium fluviatile]|uniref:hypothetical protein n=1 Tax=Flavobacterium fluviatile TaxID=1862387 RepID=UPI0013D8C1BA|nr:hypothetical protein [Flavobacterium fluviatile]